MLAFIVTDVFRMDCLIDTVYINVTVAPVPIKETSQSARATAN